MFNESAGLTDDAANRIFDVLVELAGASEAARGEFVSAQTHRFCSEYRFMGALGFGGKFWRDAYGDGTERWYINAYREDTTDEVQRVIDAVNARLTTLPR